MFVWPANEQGDDYTFYSDQKDPVRPL